MFPNTPYLRKCIAMDKLFTVWRKQNNRKKKPNNNKKKNPESYPLEKMCVCIYIYLKHNMAMYIFLVLINNFFLFF